MTVEYPQGASLPDLSLRITEKIELDGVVRRVPIDFGPYGTFEIKVWKPGQPVAFTKTDGITYVAPDDGTGLDPGYANIQVEWDPGSDIDTLTPFSEYRFQLTAIRTEDSKPRIFRGVLSITTVAP